MESAHLYRRWARKCITGNLSHLRKCALISHNYIVDCKHVHGLMAHWNDAYRIAWIAGKIHTIVVNEQ